MLTRRGTLNAFIVVGVILRVVSYAAGTPMWLDEILLSRNIIGLSMRELLFSPLALDQVAPRGFLFVEKLAVIAFGANEWALRLFPFLCGIAGLLLFRRLAERVLTGWGPPVALALFAIGVPFLRFSAEVKQYHSDATAAILLALLALDLIEPPPGRGTRRRRLAIGAAGFVVVCFSQAAVIVMGGLGIAIAGAWAITRRPAVLRAFLPAIPMWAGASVAGVALGLASMDASTKQFMHEFWLTGFAPIDAPWSWPAWYWSRVVMLFGDVSLLRYAWPAVYAALAAFGAVAVIAARGLVGVLISAPLALALVAASAQQYPFRQRLALFLVPFALLAVAATIEWLRASLSRAHRLAGVIPVAAVITPAIVALVSALPPYDHERNRDALAFLQQRRQPGDVIYVFPLSRIGLLFYGPQYGIDADGFVTGPCDPIDTRAYLRGVDPFRGRRLWVISASARPFRTARPAVQRYLETIGTHLDGRHWPSVQFGEVWIDLYDLSDPARLTAADAETFPVDPMPTDPRPGCRPWMRADAFGLR